MKANKMNAGYLEKRLTLVARLAHTLGYGNNAGLLSALQNTADGWGEHYHHALEAMRGQRQYENVDGKTRLLLEELDGEIRADWAAINYGRQTPMSLKYFQYLAALSSALFLRELAEAGEPELRGELNSFAAWQKLTHYDRDAQLNKLAFWIATGGGKTLLMHIHYHQFLRMQKHFFEPDNILLVTPNETLSQQHIAEMRASGIPCFRHGENENLLRGGADAVRVIEITKLADADEQKQKSKKGERVFVQAFAGRNLVFVDEGHKGAGGEAWFQRRDKLTENGFVFEYSATFGQALKDKDARMHEYAGAIAFDYSYRYFYRDGYGKDFFILNINDGAYPADTETNKRDLMFLGNLLSFFQQRLLYENHRTAWLPYLLEKPLLLLLGATVIGKNTDRMQTDMTALIAFLHRVASDEQWLQSAVGKIISEQSGIGGDNGRDVFADKFVYLKEQFGQDNTDVAGLCAGLRRLVFNNETAGALQCRLLRHSKPAEIILKVGDQAQPFGLLYVGESKKLCDMLKERVPGLEVGTDAIQQPLFAAAHLSESPVNLLIGAKKFMEGWSSWRVSAMGLLNVGKSEGAQIIQLFGRGIRLKGKGFSLKRMARPLSSGASADDAPKHLALLETLNIFAVRADFMSAFREYLKRENMDEEIVLPVRVNPVFEEKDLHTLIMPPPEDFERMVAVTDDAKVSVCLDLSVKTQTAGGSAGSGNTGGIVANTIADDGKKFSEVLAVLDMDDLHRRLLEYKRQSRRANLVFYRGQLSAILQNRCTVIGDDVFEMNTYNGLQRLQQIAFSALRKYADKLYRRRQRQWENDEAAYAPLQPAAKQRASDYRITVNAENKEALEEVRMLVNDAGKIYKNSPDRRYLPRLVIDQLIYIPLLLKSERGVSASPPMLTDSEEKFVNSLRDYAEKNPPAQGRQLFLLRNESKGRGFAFYQDENFFPDFILWDKRCDAQRLIFIEPHGMIHAPAYERDFKAQLWTHVRKMADGLRRKNKKWAKIDMDAYIISETPFAELQPRYADGSWTKEKFRARHILFADDGENNLPHILHDRQQRRQK